MKYLNIKRLSIFVVMGIIFYLFTACIIPEGSPYDGYPSSSPSPGAPPVTQPSTETVKMEEIFTYKSISGGAVITGIKTDAAAIQALSNALDENGILTMEETIAGFPIREIGKNAFSVFPPGQSSEKLSGGTGLLPPEFKGIRFPSSLERIGVDAFAWNEHFEFIEFPPNSRLKEISRGGFYHTGITGHLTLPASLEKIDTLGFYAAKKLVSIDLGGTKLNKIDDLAFTQCEELVSIILPPGITSIGAFGFGSCEKLKAISFPSGLRFIDEFAFSNCHSLSQVDFSAVTANQVKIGSDPVYASHTFKDIGLWGHLADPDVWVKIPAGKTIDTTGGNAGFFTGGFGTKYNTGWNALTGIVNDPNEKNSTWVKVYDGAGVQVWGQ